MTFVQSGRLIVVEGLEGAGKSTAVKTLIKLLNGYGLNAITTREPGGTAVGELLRSIIKDPKYKETLDDRSELLLLYAARIQLVQEVIKPALALGTWVIADRFELSSLAYQGGGRQLGDDIINTLSAFALNGFKPDFTLFLDLSPELGMKRALQRGAFDRIEQAGIDFFHRVHAAYLTSIAANPDTVIIDASQPLASVQRSIESAVSQFIELQHG
ncbi:MAG: dTMP kinase [Legionella sp.]